VRATVAHAFVNRPQDIPVADIPIPEPQWCPRCCDSRGPFDYDRELALWTCTVCGASFRFPDGPRA